MEGRQFRMRGMFAFEPGAVFGPLHDHKDRPGIVFILQGTITDHHDGNATDYGPGVGWPEDRNTSHWLENRGTVPAVEVLGRHRSVRIDNAYLPISARDSSTTPTRTLSYSIAPEA